MSYEKWTETSLEEITSVLGDGLHGTPAYSENGEYYFINGNNLKDGRIVTNEKTKRASKDEYLKHKRKLNHRTILVSINGTLGNIAIYNGEKVFLGKSVCYFNLIEDVDKDYVKYLLLSSYFQNYINSLATGTTIKNVSLQLMRKFTFKLPPLPIQRKIGQILSFLDDKIELNRQMNETLEQIAQAIFKHWFIDFEFPDENGEPYRSSGGEMVDSELGEIPVGWEVGTIEDICDSINSGGTPSRKNNDFWNNGNIPWFKTGELHDEPLMDSKEKITQAGLSNSSCKLWPKGTIVFALYASPTVGKLGILTKPATSNQAAAGLIVKPEYGIPFLKRVLLEIRPKIQNIATGAAQQNINLKILKSYKVIIPNSKVSRKYSNLMLGLDNQQIENKRENVLLEKIRDSILPKLMSGQIRVK